MDKPNTDVIQGTLDLLILKTLASSRCTGSGSPAASSRSRAACSR